MNKKIMAFFVVGTIMLLGAGVVFAYQGNPETQGPNYSEDRHETMQNAFDTMNYELWVETMSENSNSPKVLDIVTKENFNVFVEAHNAMLAGDIDKATELKQSIGLSMGQRNGQYDGQGKRSGQGNCQYN